MFTSLVKPVKMIEVCRHDHNNCSSQARLDALCAVEFRGAWHRVEEQNT
jgi:hypothetical protein